MITYSSIELVNGLPKNHLAIRQFNRYHAFVMKNIYYLLNSYPRYLIKRDSPTNLMQITLLVQFI